MYLTCLKQHNEKSKTRIFSQFSDLLQAIVRGETRKRLKRDWEREERLGLRQKETRKSKREQWKGKKTE